MHTASLITKDRPVRYILPILLLFICLPSFAKNDDITNVKVTSVYDGDTFKVMLPCALPVVCDYISVRVRGVDAPEFKTKDACEKKKAKEAKLFTREFLKKGSVTLRNCGKDKYFRLLCAVFVVNKETKEESSLATALLKANLAVPYEGQKKLKYNWCGNKPTQK